MLRAHPFVVAAVSLFVGVTAFGARLVVERRARRGAPSRGPAEELEAPLPAARRPAPAPPRVWRAPAPPPEAPLATLRIRVMGPHGVVVRGADIWATRRGGPVDGSTLLDENESEDGTFEATALVPGRYDVRVHASGLRDAVLEDLPVPTRADAVDVFLTRAPVLLGAVGQGQGDATCEAVTISATGPPHAAEDGDDGAPAELLANVDPQSCRFELEDLPAGPLTVVAKGRGWTERAVVTLPVEGDPAAVCFQAPCGAPPASLAIYVVDAAGRLVPEAALDWSRETETEGELGSTTVAGFALLHGRRAGQPLRLRAVADDRAVESTVFVSAGIADVVLTLPVADASPPRATFRLLVR